MWIEVVEGDITQLEVDAIVNAAAPPLLGGGGVDGAIHRAAGPRLLQACLALPEVSPGVRCRVGDVRVTPGFDLPARYVIHTVGPIWRGGNHGEAGELAACYRHAIRVASGLELTSIAFPAISCGVYGYPVAAASAVAVAVIHATQARELSITLCCYNTETANAVRRALVT